LLETKELDENEQVGMDFVLEGNYEEDESEDEDTESDISEESSSSD